jgi:hypothetical protein
MRVRELGGGKIVERRTGNRRLPDTTFVCAN